MVQAEKIKAEKPKFSVIHRKDGDADFVSALISELASEVTYIIRLNYSATFLRLVCRSGSYFTRHGRRR